MPYELFLALRYLSVRRARPGAARVTALAAVTGIACGVAALVFAAALANGFRDELRDKILRGTAHLTLVRDDARPSPEAARAVERVRGVEGVVEAAATSYTGALLTGPRATGYTVLRGLDPTAARAVAEVRRTVVAGSLETLFQEPSGEPTPAADEAHATPDKANPSAGESDESDTAGGAPGLLGDIGRVEDGPPENVVVGEELAARVGLERVGAEGWLVVGEKPDDAPGVVARARRVRVAGLFRSGLHDYDSTWTYVPLALASDLEGGGEAGEASAHETPPAGGPPRASVISVEAADIYATRELAARVGEAAGGGWTAVDWREANRPLFAALELERRTVAVIIALVMLVAALNITATLVLVVVERRADIAVLAALGAEPRGVMSVFMIEGALLGAVGALAGAALGLAACFVADRFGLVSRPADVYSIGSVPLRPRAAEVCVTALAAFAVSLLATVYPARAAARLRPAEVLRHE
ncbi:MAG TPA: FtsX-like permease family protein [Pyrinomonadaceae bacterium]|nr:FtsX-like permease family protein [Pyrinomonadaceae bacterium]